MGAEGTGRHHELHAIGTVDRAAIGAEAGLGLAIVRNALAINTHGTRYQAQALRRAFDVTVSV